MEQTHGYLSALNGCGRNGRQPRAVAKKRVRLFGTRIRQAAALDQRLDPPRRIGHNVGHFGVIRGRQLEKFRFATQPTGVYAVNGQHMEMRSEIQGGTKPLDERYGAAPCTRESKPVAGPRPQRTEYAPREYTNDIPHQQGVEGEPVAQREG